MPQPNPPETTSLPSGTPEGLLLRAAANTGKQVVLLRAAASITSCLQEVQGLGSQPPTEGGGNIRDPDIVCGSVYDYETRLVLNESSDHLEPSGVEWTKG